MAKCVTRHRIIHGLTHNNIVYGNVPTESHSHLIARKLDELLELLLRPGRERVPEVDDVRVRLGQPHRVPEDDDRCVCVCVCV